MEQLPGLPPAAFDKEDPSPDAEFYDFPRFVTHIDDGAIAAVTQVYRETLPSGGAILDLMSSWVSHLPADIPYATVIGHGMNAEELAANPRLHAMVRAGPERRPALPLGMANSTPPACASRCNTCNVRLRFSAKCVACCGPARRSWCRSPTDVSRPRRWRSGGLFRSGPAASGHRLHARGRIYPRHRTSSTPPAATRYGSLIGTSEAARPGRPVFASAKQWANLLRKQMQLLQRKAVRHPRPVD